MRHFKVVQPSPVPLYVQVGDKLRDKIFDGTFEAHSKLPAESEMGKLFMVSRITIRQALSDLQREGLIFKIPGKGTFVTKKKAEQELTHLEGFAEAMKRQGYEIHNKVVTFRTVSATEDIARRLGMKEGSKVKEIRRIRHLNREPVSLELTYLPDEIGKRLRKDELAHRDIFLILENDFNIPLGHADLQIGAVTADVALAKALQVEVGAALLRIERLTYTENGQPLDFEYLYFRSETFQYHLRIARRRNTAH